jgi:hypothetical protein
MYVGLGETKSLSIKLFIEDSKVNGSSLVDHASVLFESLCTNAGTFPQKATVAKKFKDSKIQRFHFQLFIPPSLHPFLPEDRRNLQLNPLNPRETNF